MRSKPIGTRRPAPARDVQRRRALRPEPNYQTGPADLYPVDVTTNIGPRGNKRDRFARLIITDEYVYVAASRNKGRDIESVKRYARPSGDRVQTAAKRGSWGPFSWSGCGCGNSWGIHTRAKLIELGNASAPDA
jgi:hypothetical protein